MKTFFSTENNNFFSTENRDASNTAQNNRTTSDQDYLHSSTNGAIPVVDMAPTGAHAVATGRDAAATGAAAKQMELLVATLRDA